MNDLQKIKLVHDFSAAVYSNAADPSPRAQKHEEKMARQLLKAILGRNPSEKEVDLVFVEIWPQEEVANA